MDINYYVTLIRSAGTIFSLVFTTELKDDRIEKYVSLFVIISK